MSRSCIILLFSLTSTRQRHIFIFQQTKWFSWLQYQVKEPSKQSKEVAVGKLGSGSWMMLNVHSKLKLFRKEFRGILSFRTCPITEFYWQNLGRVIELWIYQFLMGWPGWGKSWGWWHRWEGWKGQRNDFEALHEFGERSRFCEVFAVPTWHWNYFAFEGKYEEIRELRFTVTLYMNRWVHRFQEKEDSKDASKRKLSKKAKKAEEEGEEIIYSAVRS